MPWGPKDSRRHTRKAKTPKLQRQWAHVAESVRKRTGNEGRAVRAANAVVSRAGKRKRARGRSR